MLRDEPFERALSAAIARARSAWPTVEVEASRFERYIVARLPGVAHNEGGAALDAVAAFDAVASLDAPGLYIACACSDGDERAMSALEVAYFDDATASLRRMAPSSSFVDEVRQDVREKLFVGKEGLSPKIADFAGRGDLRTFVRVLMTRTGLNLRRKTRRELLVEDDASHGMAGAAVAHADPELSHLQSAYGAEFKRAFHDAIVALSSEERNLLRYHYLDRLNIDEIGAVCGVHRASAARRLTKVRQSLVEATRRLLAQRLRLQGHELASVLRLIESALDVSLRRALADASARA